MPTILDYDIKYLFVFFVVTSIDFMFLHLKFVFIIPLKGTKSVHRILAKVSKNRDHDISLHVLRVTDGEMRMLI